MNSNFLKKHWSNILFFLLLALVLIPQTRMPIQVFVQRIFSFAPKETSNDSRSMLNDYDWKLVTPESTMINFSESKGEVIVLNYWATWCPPCIAEMPSLQKLYDLYKNDVAFYFVSSEEPEVLNKFMEKHQYNFPVYIQKFQAPELLNSTVLPTTFVIGKNGAIVVEETGAADWSAKKVTNLIDKLLKE